MNDRKKTTKSPQISGIVIAAKWNEKGDVTGVTIQTHDEQVYLVEQNKTGDELLNLVRRMVTARGKVRKKQYGPAIIRVQSYEILTERLNR